MPPVEAAEPYTAVLPQVDDADLLRGVHDGNRAALVALYHRHAGMVLAQIGLLVGPTGASRPVEAAHRATSHREATVLGAGLRLGRDCDDRAASGRFPRPDRS